MFLIGLGLVVIPADQSPELAAALKSPFHMLAWMGLTFRKTSLISRQPKSAKLIDFPANALPAEQRLGLRTGTPEERLG